MKYHLLFFAFGLLLNYADAGSKIVLLDSRIYKNMRYALRGYSIRDGNPLGESGDPGFLSQIFLPSVLNQGTSTYRLADGITAVDLNYCKRSMKAQTFTNTKSYRDYLTTKSSIGVNLQIGIEQEVTDGLDIKGIKSLTKASIPPPFTRAWGDSRGMTELKTFFSKKQGLVTLAMGQCYSYEVQLDTHYLPPFTTPFKYALKNLHRASFGSLAMKKSKFIRFIRQYGTHFTVKTKLGTQFIHETRYSGSVRRQFNADKLRACSNVKGSKIFGIQMGKDRSTCTNSDKRRLDAMSRDSVKEIIVTKGSRLTDIKNWVTQSFTPVPLQFQLSPIVNLFTNHNLKINNKVLQSSAHIRKWFLPMYLDYCKIFDVSCQPHTGCGYDDSCPIDTVCIGSGKTHRCSAWSIWKCEVNCGQGRNQKRTRRCIGCSGQIVQTQQSHECRLQNPCYLNYTQVSLYTPFNVESHKIQYLDRHWLQCPSGKGIRGFRLQRSGHGQFRYNYICGSIQYPCRDRVVDNPKTINGGNNNMVYLDRQNVDCGHNSIITKFRLRNHGSRSWYNYNCCKLTFGRQQCQYHFTAYDLDGDGHTIFLDRQNVMCPFGTTMSHFRLMQNKQVDKIRYGFRCCKTVN